MKILLAYFSGTGNTKKIAELYARELDRRGATVSICQITKDTPELDFDMIGIGYPVHAFNAPKKVLDFVKTLPAPKKSGKRVPAFIFKTSGEPVRMNDISSVKLKKLLNKKGYHTFNEYGYCMPYNIIFRHTDEMAYRMWTTAQALVPIDVSEIIARTPHSPKKLFCGGLLAWIMRIEHPGAHIIGKTFKATDACTNCGACQSRCPTENIKVKDGKIKFGGKCMLCMRCTFDCPNDAINAGILKAWKVNGKYSFKMPDSPSPPTKHDNYCKKAYDRYFSTAEQRIKQFNNEL